MKWKVMARHKKCNSCMWFRKTSHLQHTSGICEAHDWNVSPDSVACKDEYKGKRYSRKGKRDEGYRGDERAD